MPFGTACNRLRRQIMFGLIQTVGMDICCKCGEHLTAENFSIEHLEPWLDVDPDLFWDLDNVAFSHRACNQPHRRVLPNPNHGRKRQYERGCRCDQCKAAKSVDNAKYRTSRCQSG